MKPFDIDKLIEKLEQCSPLDTIYVGVLVRFLKDMNRGNKHKSEKHKLTDLKGLGKEIYKGIDAQEYVNNLRSEWEPKKKLTKAQYKRNF